MMNREQKIGSWFLIIMCTVLFLCGIFAPRNNPAQQTIKPLIDSVEWNMDSSMHVFTIEDDTYEIVIDVIITKDIPKISHYLMSNIDTSCTIKFLQDCNGVTCSNNAGYIVIWLESMSLNYKDIAVANHELEHVIHIILSRAGIQLNDKTDEVYAYELSFLSREFYKHIPCK